MFRKIIVITLIAISFTVLPAFASTGTSRRAPSQHQKFDIAGWLITGEASRWTAEETALVSQVVQETISSLDSAGLDGAALLDGYRFRRWAGEYAKDQDGKIAVVNHNDREIVLSDTIFLPEYHFFIYHELGHVVNRRSGGQLSNVFHGLIGQIDGVVIRHDWTTAEGFWFRGQAHINRDEAIADAFALWVWQANGYEIPSFHDTPETVQWKAIIVVFTAALAETF